MIAEAVSNESVPAPVAFVSQSPLTTAATIMVSITSPTDPNNVGIQIPANQRYLSVVENFDDTLTWRLDTSNAEGAFFDRPGIVFLNSPGPLEIVRISNKELLVDWSNVNEATRGQSFNYRLQVIVPIDGNLIPVVHDPTVHNDPPTT